MEILYTEDKSTKLEDPCPR